MESLFDHTGVAETTPLMLQDAQGQMTCMSIEDIFLRCCETMDMQHEVQTVHPVDWKIWSDGGFTRVRTISRRAAEVWRPRMLRLLTHTASVDVIDNQLLVKRNGQVIRAGDVEVGACLMHAGGPEPWEEREENEESVDWVKGYYYGAFYANGTCGIYWDKNRCKTAKWSISKHNRALLEKLRRYAMITVCADGFPQCTFKIYTGKSGTGGYDHGHYLALSGTRKSDYVTATRQQFYTTDKMKRVPDMVLNGSHALQRGFVSGYCDGDGTKTIPQMRRFGTKGAVGAAGLNWVMQKMGFAVSISLPPSSTAYNMTLSVMKQKRDACVVKKIIDQGCVYRHWIYSVDSDNCVFCAGVGTLVCASNSHV